MYIVYIIFVFKKSVLWKIVIYLVFSNEEIVDEVLCLLKKIYIDLWWYWIERYKVKCFEDEKWIFVVDK